MIKVFVMIGIQGSGKSTVGKYLARQENAIVVSTDEIRRKVSSNPVVFKIFFATAKSLVRQGKNIIMDATNINESYRKGIFQNLAEFDCKFIACVLDTDRKTCGSRIKQREKTDPKSHVIPLHLVDEYFERFGYPTKEEGFDEIRVFDAQEQTRVFQSLLSPKG